jgi:hypothetical protein
VRKCNLDVSAERGAGEPVVDTADVDARVVVEKGHMKENIGRRLSRGISGARWKSP